jgi:phenylalanine ammonia-lyase
MDAVELVSLMTAAHLYTVCQALDLHVMYLEYMSVIEREAEAAFTQSLGGLASAWEEVLIAIRAGLTVAKSKDTPLRARAAAEATIVPIMRAIPQSLTAAGQIDLTSIDTWVGQLTEIVTNAIRSTRIRFASDPPTLQYLGHGSAIMYSYVRHKLGVPLHKGLLEHPVYPDDEREGVRLEGEKVTIGSRISTIYAALRSGSMRGVLIKSLS